MARPLPVNLLLAGTGAVLLVSGIGGEPIGKVLEGSFGKLAFNPKASPSSKENTAQQTTAAGEGAEGQAVPASYSPSEEAARANSPYGFAPSPTEIASHRVSKEQETRSIAAILSQRGITNPTAQQIQEAYDFYHSK